MSSLGILIACGKGKARQRHDKPTQQGEAYGLQYKRGGVLMNKANMFIMGYDLVVILRREDWNELTGHSNDRGKDSPNSKANSLQPEEDDVDWTYCHFIYLIFHYCI